MSKMAPATTGQFARLRAKSARILSISLVSLFITTLPIQIAAGTVGTHADSTARLAKSTASAKSATPQGNTSSKAVPMSAAYVSPSKANSACKSTGQEAVKSNKSHYALGETAQISGSGFAPSCSVVVKVFRPDHSVVKGDGKNTPGSDEIITDANGNFTYSYLVTDLAGRWYNFDILGKGDAGLAGNLFSAGPIVWTDKGDYLPGDTVTISGLGWQPGETVQLSIHDSTGRTPDRLLFSTADDNGAFKSREFTPAAEHLGVLFDLKANGMYSGYSAQHKFMDGPSFVKTIGTDTETGNGTSMIVAVPAGGVAAGNSVIVGIQVASNNVLADVSCSDPVNGSYQKDASVAGGNFTVILSKHTMTALPAGQNITCTFKQNAVDSAMSVSEFSGLSATPLDKVAVAANTGTGLKSSGLTATTTQADELVFGLVMSPNGVTPATGGTTAPITEASYTPAYTSIGPVTTLKPFYRVPATPALRTYEMNGTVTGAGTPSNSFLVATYKAAGSSTYSISGTKFNDLNGNGVKDGGEPGLPGWTIFIDANSNGTLDGGETSTTTDGSGNYTFGSLAAGTYRIREVLQPGWTQLTPNPADVVITSTNVSGIDFGNFESISVSGQKFNDLNGNGVKDGGEPGLPGWTIYNDANNSSTLDGGDQSAVTDAGGNYTITGNGTGTVRIREVSQAGWIQTTANPPAFAASSGSNVSGVDIGNFQLISVSGQKFNDLNGNGIKDGGEPGLQGWTIYNDANNNATLDGGDQSAVTDAGGNYIITGIGPGTVRIREVGQAGWVQTTSNPTPSAASSGSNLSGVDFGNFQLVSISGKVFDDQNNNATLDGGESGISGRTVFLDLNSNNALDLGETSTTTDGSGDYSFSNLGPGSHVVRQVVPAGFTQTTANPAAITAVSGTNVTNVLFGTVQQYSIGGQITGVCGTCDGITVNLTGGQNASTTTAGGGFYSFTNLAGGLSYTVTPSGGGFAYSPSSTTHNGLNSNQNSTNFVAVTPTAVNVGDVLISEFRTSGPSGANDEFVELYNNTYSPIIVGATDGSVGWSVAASDGVTRFIVPNGTVIPARGHFLGVNNTPSTGYSLPVASDATYLIGISDNAGIALFTTSIPANYSIGTRLDMAGSSSEPDTLYRTASGYAPHSTFNLEGSFHRDQSSGLPANTGSNLSDFRYADTQGSFTGAGQQLGAPGPENLNSPVQMNALVNGTLVDPGAPIAAGQNRVRNVADTGTNKTYGTMAVRRKFTNNTGAPVSQLKFRVVTITTFPAPNAATADVRALSSASPGTVSLTGGGTAFIEGTTLEMEPIQPNGGGLNSALVVNLGSALAPGDSVNVQWLLGVQQKGSFQFYVNVEAK